MSAIHSTFGASGPELPLDQVARRRDPRDPDRGAQPLAGPDPGDTGRFHEPRHALAPDPDPVLEPQLGVDPRSHLTRPG
jgi:hypothetical protein